MEKLKKALEALEKDDLTHIAERLELSARSSAATIAARLGSLEGLDRIVGGFDERELELFAALAVAENGLTISELEKNTRLRNGETEAIIEHLRTSGVLYILKNRKHLNNRLDRVHLHQPILDLLRPIKRTELAALLKSLTTQDPVAVKKIPAEVKANEKLFELLGSHDGIVTLAEATSALKKNDAALARLAEDGVIEIRHLIEYPFSTVITPTEKYFPHIFAAGAAKKGPDVCNGYMLVNNILRCYDAVSTYGLFLTQQSEFRKVDRKRVSDSCYHVYDQTGHALSGDETSQLCLAFMQFLKLVSLRKDAVFTDLSPLGADIYHPLKVIKRVLTRLRDKVDSSGVFAPPFPLPTRSELDALANAASSGAADPNRLRTVFFAASIAASPAQLARLAESRQLVNERFNFTLRLALALGLVEIRGGVVSLSAIGSALVNNREPQPDKGSGVFINPDFSMIIPKDTVSPETVYTIIAYSDLTKDDVIYSTKITKDSVLRAYKRGMDITEFSATLKEIKGNELPQNLNFLLGEWVNQTLKVEIALVNLIQSSKPEFIESLLTTYGDRGVRRIGESYAVIPMELFDDVVKLAEKNKAVIRISCEDAE